MRAMISRTSYGLRGSALTMPVQLVGVVLRILRRHAVEPRGFHDVQPGHNRPAQPQRVIVVLGQIVGDARHLRVNIGAAELFGAHLFARRGSDERGPPRKIVPVPLTMMVSSDMAGT